MLAKPVMKNRLEVMLIQKDNKQKNNSIHQITSVFLLHSEDEGCRI